MTFEKALEILVTYLSEHPEAVGNFCKWFEKAWESLSAGQQLALMLMLLPRLLKGGVKREWGELMLYVMSCLRKTLET